MEFILTNTNNGDNKITVGWNQYKDVLLLAERFDWRPTNPNPYEDKNFVVKKDESIWNYLRFEYHVSEDDALGIAYALSKALKKVKQDWNSVPDLQYYHKYFVNHDNCHDCRASIEKMIEFLQCGAFKCSIYEDPDDYPF